jgi:hypothetical protein
MIQDNPFQKYLRKLSDSSLLISVIFTIFIIDLFPSSLFYILYPVGYSLIFILAATAVKKYRSGIFAMALFILLLQWLSFMFVFPLLNETLNILSILFFFIIVISFIMQVATAKEVSPKVILESINGYLLLGLAFSMVIALVMHFNPDAFNFTGIDATTVEQQGHFGSYVYYAFVTLTTLGYGDVIPKTPGTKSLAIFIAIVGQFYIAIIIATLVSKYLYQKKS